MTAKDRLSVTVDAEMLVAAHAAVEAGRAENVSAWVNEALHRQYDHERRMSAFASFLEAYEAEHGEITEAEMERAARDLRSQAVVVRGSGKRRRRA